MYYMAVFITVSRQSYVIKKQQNEILLSSRLSVCFVKCMPDMH